MNSSFTNSTNATNVSYVVTVELWIQYIVFYTIFGVFGILENVCLIVLIAVDKKLQTFFFILIAGHCLGQIFYCSGNIIVGIYRLLPAFVPELIYITRLQCHFVNLLVYFCPSFSSLTMVFLAADRCYAVGRPSAYHRCSAKRGLMIIGISIVFTLLIKVAPSYIGSVALSTIVACTTAKVAVTAEWWNYNYCVNCMLIFLGILLYCALLTIAILRARSLTKGTFSHDDVTNRRLKKQLKLLGTIRALIVINVLTVLPFVVLLILSNYYPPPVASRLVAYGASLNAIDMIVEPFALYVSSSALKNARKLIVNRNSTTVQPITGGTSVITVTRRVA